MIKHSCENISNDILLKVPCVCRICHSEGDEECPLITPCRCTGSLRFVHHACLHQWIKSSNTRCCELCKYNFVMEMHLKPLRKVSFSHAQHSIPLICKHTTAFVIETHLKALHMFRSGIHTHKLWRHVEASQNRQSQCC